MKYLLNEQFLTEIFDAMFAILESGIEGVDSGVMNALVVIINVLVDDKRALTTGINFRPVLDTYITQHFSGVMVHKHLMKCLKFGLEQVQLGKTTVSHLISTFKVQPKRRQR